MPMESEHAVYEVVDVIHKTTQFFGGTTKFVVESLAIRLAALSQTPSMMEEGQLISLMLMELV